MTRQYKRYLNSKQWKRKREKVLMRDGYKCVRCSSVGEVGKPLQVHHLTYERIFHEQLDDLETLCKPCHEEEHKSQPKEKKKLVKKLNLQLPPKPPKKTKAKTQRRKKRTWYDVVQEKGNPFIPRPRQTPLQNNFTDPPNQEK